MTNSRTGAAAAYRPDVDGLRAVAIGSVLLFHAFPSLFPGGFIGVDIFFVISGFLITGNIYRGIESGSFSISGFYLRRVRRIFPALLLVLTCCLLAGWMLLSHVEFMQLGKHTAAAAGFAANFFYWAESGYFDKAAISKPLLHLWSLGVEEQFYLMWPLLIIFTQRKGKTREFALAVLLVSFAACVWTTSPQSSGAFYSPATRMWELSLGGILALAGGAQKKGAADWTRGRTWLRELASFGGIVLIAAAVRTFEEGTSYPGWKALLPTVGAFLVIAAGEYAVLNRWVLSHPVMVFVGLISYPLYLWHWPLLSFANIVRLGIVPISLRIWLLAASAVLATGTFLLLERPLRRTMLTWRLGRAMVGTMACLGIAGSVVYASGGTDWGTRRAAFGSTQPTRLTLYRRNVDKAARALPGNGDPYLYEVGMTRYKAVRSGICEVSDAQSVSRLKDGSVCGEPIVGATNTLVMGDSIASDTYAWLHAAYPKYNLIQKTGPGCNLQRVDRDNPQPCAATLKSARALALSPTQKIDAIVLSSLWNMSMPQDVDRTQAGPLIDRLLATGRKVVLVGPPVGFTVEPRDLIDKCPSSSKDGLTFKELEQCAREHATARRDCNTALKQYAHQKGLPYIDLHELSCNATECPVLDEQGQLMYLDVWHRTFFGDAFLARQVRQNHVFERILGTS